MDPRQSIQRWTRFMGLALIVATLPACQKNRLSSVPPQQPAYRPGGYPPASSLDIQTPGFMFLRLNHLSLSNRRSLSHRA